MDNKNISYSLTIKMPSFIRHSNESDEDFAKRVKEEGQIRARAYLTGYLFDPENKTIFEKTSLGNE